MPLLSLPLSSANRSCSLVDRSRGIWSTWSSPSGGTHLAASSNLTAPRRSRRILGKTADGQPIDAATVERYLTALGAKHEKTSAETYAVTLPSWRLDLAVEIDLIEEIARLHGYNRFANTLPSFSGSVTELPWAAKESHLRRTLRAAGYTEAISSTFCSAADANTFAQQPNSIVQLGNPLSEEVGFLPALAGSRHAFHAGA